MARSENNLTAVFADTATAIRAKKGTVDLIEPRDFADEVASIPTGIEPSGTLNIVNSEDNIDVTDYAAVNVRIPYAVGKDDGNYSSNLSSKVFGIDGNYSYINDPWIEDDTFYCTLGSAGMDAMYISQDSGDIQLDVDEDWTVEKTDSEGSYFEIITAILKPDTQYLDISTDIIVYAIEVDEQATYDYLEQNYPNARLKFIDLLGHQIAQVYLRDVLEFGGS